MSVRGVYVRKYRTVDTPSETGVDCGFGESILPVEHAPSDPPPPVVETFSGVETGPGPSGGPVKAEDPLKEKER